MNTMLDYMIYFSLFTLAFSAGIVMKSEDRVSLGADVTFSCSLPGATGVKQVTWQQLSEQDGSVRKMVTFSELLQYEVAEPYVGKVDVTESSHSATTIVIRNVTFADETCYVCTFNAYPSGTKRKKACLAVEGVLGMTASVKPLHDSPTKTKVSCSATGKPTPVISWNLTEEDLRNFTESNHTTINDDGTETTTSTIKIPLARFQGQSVECVGRSGISVRSEMIYVDPSKTPEVKVNDVKSRSYVVSFVVIGLLVVGMCIAIVFHKRRKQLAKFNIDVV